MYDGALVTNHEDGHICTEDIVAVLWEYTFEKGQKASTKQKRQAHVWCGRVESLSCKVNNKPKKVPIVYLEEEEPLVCKYYYPVES